jgi:CBS domain-containing protein
MFLEFPYRAYPVVRDGQLVGLLTRADLLAAFLNYG